MERTYFDLLLNNLLKTEAYSRSSGWWGTGFCIYFRPGRFRGVRVGSLEWTLWLAAVCLRISVLGSAAGSRCLFLGEWYGVLLLWAGKSLNQNLKSKYVNRMKLFMTLEHFFSRINKTYALTINARLCRVISFFFLRKRLSMFQGQET